MHFGDMADDQGGNNIVMREYRKGNWTVNETMVLIEAKKMDDERRLMKKSGDHSEGRGVSKPAELRWKWVEEYCWRKGCLRSQNQCNDKWDNLMRDFKKVRDYQRRIMAENNGGSYWEIEKNERKEKNLPSNMLREIYDRLEEEVVVEKKGGGGGRQRVVAAAAGGGSGGPNIPNMTYVLQPSLPPLFQHQLSAPIPASIPLPIPAPPPLLPPPTAIPEPVEQPPPLSYAQPLPILVADSSDSDTSEYSNSPAKRRRQAGNREGSTGGGAASNSNDQVGTAISKSASIIAEAIHVIDESEEKRHKDLVSLYERRLKIEESKTELNKRSIDGLVNAINKLANSILALASSRNNQSTPR